jgi:hypothetical protein
MAAVPKTVDPVASGLSTLAGTTRRGGAALFLA